jgi:3-methylcrotonyl-CoA carboxylase alpha subunit
MITGQDLVQWQIEVASGKPLPLTQEQLKIQGHSIEARIYSEQPFNNFLPASGYLHYLREPSADANIRVESGVQQGD